ncbi:MAG: hypothetical protein DIZ80_03750 [endosymbiont of Galathealinum brachiosum]|uniref:Maltoporin n=1 Tax=endosymbiont of Galathealinum brachiosum TaxID=2200906 RepID=A0A370DI49_9GAMM|nr:MAG: hypothetical protein DIZ80_03750 [endosymbiont of Galathealinum brachiosum]
MINKNILIFIIFIISSKTYAIDILTGQDSLEFHGYFRGGLGSSESGATQAKFQAPGARAKYRLGNEPETNMELQLTYTYDMKEPENENSHVQGIIMLDGFKHHGESNSFTVDNLAQGYLSFNNFFNNEIKLWVGRRYYDRKSIHIMNHYWLNPGQRSQAGAGIEDINTGSGKLDIALFRYEDDFDINGTSHLINSTSIDTRWHDLNINDNLKLTLWAGLSLRHANDDLNYEDKSGYGLGGWLDHKHLNIKNTSVIIYQTGSAITQADFNPNPIREDKGWELDNATALEISNTLTYESLPDHSIQWTLLYRHEDHGFTENTDFSWYSTGARPIFYFSKHINLAFEAGIDYVDDEVNNRNGTLTKLSTVLQISADRGLKSRPVLRFFVTLAEWSDELKGLIGHFPGNAPYANDTQGWTVGAQAEVWW